MKNRRFQEASTLLFQTLLFQYDRGLTICVSNTERRAPFVDLQHGLKSGQSRGTFPSFYRHYRPFGSNRFIAYLKRVSKPSPV